MKTISRVRGLGIGIFLKLPKSFSFATRFKYQWIKSYFKLFLALKTQFIVLLCEVGTWLIGLVLCGN